MSEPNAPSQPAAKRSYKDTLNLPRTAFSMKANLVQNEPQAVKRWAENGLYDKLRAARAGSPPFVFHDGPPYANGSIHLGHLLNKCLKDFVVRSRSMMGCDVPYVPGWDCHGLPIEHKVVQELGPAARDMEPIKVRRKCQASAEKFVKLQSAQMQRLLTLADYDHPYLTMHKEYEAASLEVFARLIEQGLVYRALKPVHWSIENQTALADAELEYYDREDTSVYVLFDVVGGAARLGESVSLMIWTTTPWTLPANMAVAVHEKYDYGLYPLDTGGRQRLVVIATALAPKVFGLANRPTPEPVKVLTGRELVELGIRYQHPLPGVNRTCPVVSADYVTLEDGTGLVHTAPGHGVEDYQTGLRVGLEVYCPVKGDGTFDDTAPDWLRPTGQRVDVWKANDLVVEKLRASGHLFHSHTFTHSYPHDWRGKTPVIFRATEQWFVGVDRPLDHDAEQTIRRRAMRAVENDVTFYPDWGRNRLRGMLETRPDWCISRQRAWGLPIPAFYPPEGVEGRPLLTAASVRAVAKVIAEKGSDAWFLMSPHDLLAHYDPATDPDAPAWATSEIRDQKSAIRKSNDIFDVWFDSGTSWASVIRQRFGPDSLPTDLYLEGSDQHRGWFQASLLPAVATLGHAPFRGVLTHGFMVDKDGRKMSKSLGNTLEVEELMKKHGADVCRWWVASLNTDNDIKVDPGFFDLAGESYRKVRNTLRYLLSNLYDYVAPSDPGEAMAAIEPTTLDAWALGELDKLIDTVRKAYETYDFARVHESIFNFCNDTLSAVYLSATKDRLYCDAKDSPRRRRTQASMDVITDSLIRLIAPILPYTADEAWTALHPGGGAESVHLATLPERTGVRPDAAWGRGMELRESWLKAVEDGRGRLGIDNPLDIGLTVPADASLSALDAVDLADLCMISRWSTGEVEGLVVCDLRNEPRCERSWKRDGTVKLRGDGGMLSDRDAAVLGLE